VDGNGKFDPVRPEQVKVITGVREIK